MFVRERTCDARFVEGESVRHIGDGDLDGSIAVASTELSPIALTSRDQVLAAIGVNDLGRVERTCYELLEANTRGMGPESVGVRACVAAVIEGVLAALASTRTNILRSAMHAVARYAAECDGSNAMSVATIIKDAAEVLEVAEGDEDLRTAIEAALSACDRLLGSERDHVLEFLRDTLSAWTPPGDAGDFADVSP